MALGKGDGSPARDIGELSEGVGRRRKSGEKEGGVGMEDRRRKVAPLGDSY